MSEEQTPVEVPTTTEEAPIEQPPVETEQQDATPPAATPSLAELLDKADPDQLRKHPKFWGMVGSEAQRRAQEQTKRQQDEQAAHTREQTESELFKFFEDNADYVKQNYPKAYERFAEMQQERAQREIEGLRGKTVSELATNIGRSLQDVPEWKELTPADHEALAKALMGKPDHEVIPLFNRMVIDLVADKRASRLYDERYAKKEAELREAIRQEEAAKLLQKSEAPDLTKAKGSPAKVNVQGMTHAEFAEYQKQLGLA